MASPRWRGSILSAASRSAIVRATFRMRSCARAESPRRVTAVSSNFSPSALNRAVLADQRRVASGRSRRRLFAGESFQLAAARTDHAFAHGGGIFDGGFAAQFLIFHRGDFDVNVDAVQQRAGNFRDVALDLRRAAVAFARGVAEEAARGRDSWLRRA